MEIQTNCREHAYDVEITVNNKTVTQTRVYGSDWWRWQIHANTVQWDALELVREEADMPTTFGQALQITKAAKEIARLQD